MKIYSKHNVLEAAKSRIRYLFDEFEEIVISFSGGKDSTVIFFLALEIAKEKNRIPLTVLWIDQEAEWQATVDLCEKIMTRKDVNPLWMQIPMVITNNASSFDRYSYCWDDNEKDKWIHEKNNLSLKENIYKTNRFHKLFPNIIKVHYSNKRVACLGGVRVEESPSRTLGLVCRATYKHITYGKILNKDKHYTFYPIYDWLVGDVWKYIHENKLPYNEIYNKLYQHGIPLREMRVSNVHHETALKSLLLVQELEPITWNKISKRINGANTIKHIKNNSYACPAKLPFMFSSWSEYAIYLANNIIQEEKYKEILLKHIKKDILIYANSNIEDKYWKTVINTILSSDWDFTKLNNFNVKPDVYSYRMFKKGIYSKHMLSQHKTFKLYELEQINLKLNG